MIRAEFLLGQLRQAGFGLFSGVPCSYLTPLMNCAIDCRDVHYVNAANEGDAVAVGCGSQLGGTPAVVMFQNSGFGNAVSPLTSLNAIFHIPVLVLTTWRGQPGGPADEPQHAMMGRITTQLFDLLEIPWELLPDNEEQVAPMLERAVGHMRSTNLPYGLVLTKGVVAPYALESPPAAERAPQVSSFSDPLRAMERHQQDDVLRAIQAGVRPSDVVIATTGYTGRALYALADRPNQLYMVGSMGCASSFGLGLAKAQPRRRVIVLDGDGALLMRMGALAAIGQQQPPNLLHVLLDNGVHDSTGAQPTLSASTDPAAVAWACGYPHVLRAACLADLQQVLHDPAEGLTFVHIKTEPRSNRKLPRPDLTPIQVAQRLRVWLRDAPCSPSELPAQQRMLPSNGRICLLNPGPVTLSPRVRKALLRADLCHREPQFAQLQDDIRRRLARVYAEAERDYAAVLLTGSGTAAVEAMIGSLVPPDGKALVVANGVYGERIASMLEIHGKACAMVRSPWPKPMNLQETENRLAREGGFTHVIAVHHETTTGRLNDVGALGAICRRWGVSLLLDAVSSFAGEWLDFENWNLEAVAATANKCLHGVPGISFVLARKSALQQERGTAPCLYLDLFRNYREQLRGYPLFTPAVQVLYALQEALMELEDLGGWRQRHEHYRRLSEQLRGGLEDHAFRLFLEDQRAHSATLTSFELPPAVGFQDLYGHLRRRGFVIYPGQQSLQGAIFRVAVMGDLSAQDIDGFLRSVGMFLASRRDHPPGDHGRQELSEIRFA